MLTTPVEIMLFAIAGGLNEEQRHKIEFLQEQVRVLQELDGDRHLRRAIAGYVDHDHHERAHQGLGNRLIEGVPGREPGRVVRHERLGGLLNHYYREAA